MPMRVDGTTRLAIAPMYKATILGMYAESRAPLLAENAALRRFVKFVRIQHRGSITVHALAELDAEIAKGSR